MDFTGLNESGGIAVVVGATGGIGAGLLEQLKIDAHYTDVLGLGRRSDPKLDLLDESSIAACADHVSRLAPLRLLIDATGVLHEPGAAPEKSFRQIEPSQLAHAFAVNAIGPALLMKHFLPLLSTDGRSVFATLSARVGSIGDNRLGGWYSYRASKAALNQLVHTAAIELRRRNPSALCVALHPGTVDTALSRPFAKTGLEVVSPQTAARRLLITIARLKSSDSGQLLDYQGLVLPW